MNARLTRRAMVVAVPVAVLAAAIGLMRVRPVSAAGTEYKLSVSISGTLSDKPAQRTCPKTLKLSEETTSGGVRIAGEVTCGDAQLQVEAWTATHPNGHQKMGYRADLYMRPCARPCPTRPGGPLLTVERGWVIGPGSARDAGVHGGNSLAEVVMNGEIRLDLA